MSEALEATRAAEKKREDRLRAKDVEALKELEQPTADLVDLYARISMKMRSRDGTNHMNQAANALRNALKAVEAITESDDAD